MPCGGMVTGGGSGPLESVNISKLTKWESLREEKKNRGLGQVEKGVFFTPLSFRRPKNKKQTKVEDRRRCRCSVYRVSDEG